MTKAAISTQDIDALRAKIEAFAKARRLTSVHAYKVCARHLATARMVSAASARYAGVTHAHTHFQFLKAAAAERAGR